MQLNLFWSALLLPSSSEIAPQEIITMSDCVKRMWLKKSAHVKIHCHLVTGVGEGGDEQVYYIDFEIC